MNSSYFTASLPWHIGRLQSVCFYFFISLAMLAPAVHAGNKELPAFFSNPPADTADYLYGVGQGSDLERAQSAALADVARKLMVSVSSRTDVRVFNDGQQTNESFQQNLSTEVGKTQLSHYEVIENTRYNDEVLTLIRINRSELARNSHQQWQSEDDAVNQEASRYQSLSKVHRVMASKAFTHKIEQAEAKLWIYLSIQPNFKPGPYTTNYNNYRQQINQARDSLQFSFAADPDSENIAQATASLFSEWGLNASLSKKQPTSTLVNFTTQTKSRKLDQEYFQQLTVIINVKDESGRNLATKKYLGTGQSFTNAQEALNQASLDVNQQLARIAKRRGPLVAVGLRKKKSNR